MKKTNTPKEEKTPPLPSDKPATYGNNDKAGNDTGTRHDKGKSKIKSDNDNPQKTREKMEIDHTKKEEDPGMTQR